MEPDNSSQSAARSKERVAIALQLEVSGCAVDGRDFLERASTKMISRGGAAIVVNRRLAPQQTITIKRVGSEQEAEGRVVAHLGNDPAGGELYGIVLPNAASNFWGVDFPSDETEEPLVKVLLECPGCRTRKMAALSQVEFDVFETKQYLSRNCSKCRDITLWRQTLYSVLPDTGTTPREPPERLPSSPNVPASSEVPQPNRRKHTRVKMGVKACILFYGQETPVEVIDMSRSGIRFRSHRSFAEELLVRVAVPYTPGAANIFVSGKICWCRTLPSGLSECGLEYAPTSPPRK
jgi:PilZ domain